MLKLINTQTIKILKLNPISLTSLLQPTMDKWFHVQDTCGVHNLHGLPGLLSAVASAIAAGVASNTAGTNLVNYGSR